MHSTVFASQNLSVLCFLPVAEELRELRRREKEQGIQSNWEIDSFMAADTLEGKREAIVTEYMLRILGLDVSILMPIEG